LPRKGGEGERRKEKKREGIMGGNQRMRGGVQIELISDYMVVLYYFGSYSIIPFSLF